MCKENQVNSCNRGGLSKPCIYSHHNVQDHELPETSLAQPQQIRIYETIAAASKNQNTNQRESRASGYHKNTILELFSGVTCLSLMFVELPQIRNLHASLCAIVRLIIVGISSKNFTLNRHPVPVERFWWLSIPMVCHVVANI